MLGQTGSYCRDCRLTYDVGDGCSFVATPQEKQRDKEGRGQTEPRSEAHKDRRESRRPRARTTQSPHHCTFDGNLSFFPWHHGSALKAAALHATSGTDQTPVDTSLVWPPDVKRNLASAPWDNPSDDPSHHAEYAVSRLVFLGG